MKKFIHDKEPVKASSDEVNPVRNGVYSVTDVDAFDFDNFDDTLDCQYKSFEDYLAWMERYYESDT